MERYSAFISYSHADETIARWLHRSIETYRFPKALIGAQTAFGAVPRRLPPVFRDRDELQASGDLGAELRSALAASRFQIVLCSPRAASSKWVNEEIIAFKRTHGEGRTLALILAGEPYAGGEAECFPPALRFRLGSDGALSDLPAEPIAADIRPGKDGRRLALLKLLAGMSGVTLDGLVRRDAARRQRRMVLVTTVSLTIAVLTIGLAIYAEVQRRAADRQRLLAERSLDFLVGTFAIANPATENPRTITAITILDRASKRAAMELRAEPGVGARLLRTTGDIYYNLGLLREAERDLEAVLRLEPPRSEGRARALLGLAKLAYRRRDAADMTAFLAKTATAYEPASRYAGAIEAELLEQRGLAKKLEGRYGEAARLLHDAAAGLAGLEGDHGEALGRIWMAEAEMQGRLLNFDAADDLLEKAQKAYTAKYGPNDVRTATTIQNRALNEMESGRLGQAGARIDQAVAIYDKVLEGDHLTIANALVLSGRIRTQSGNAVAALRVLDRAKGIFSRLYGPDNSTVGDVDFYAAEAEAKAGRLDAALARLANTRRIYDAAYGPDDPDQAELLLQRARVLAGAGRRAAAAADCGAALALQVKLKTEAAVLAETRRACAGYAAR